MRRSLPILGLGVLLGCALAGTASAQQAQPYPANPPPPGSSPPAPPPGAANGANANGVVGPGSQASPNRIVNDGMNSPNGAPGPNGAPNGAMNNGMANNGMANNGMGGGSDSGMVGAPASSQPDPNNCGTPDEPKACPPMPKVPLRHYPANKS